MASRRCLGQREQQIPKFLLLEVLFLVRPALDLLLEGDVEAVVLDLDGSGVTYSKDCSPQGRRESILNYRGRSSGDLSILPSFSRDEAQVVKEIGFWMYVVTTRVLSWGWAVMVRKFSLLCGWIS